jgi:hypothetical protein
MDAFEEAQKYALEQLDKALTPEIATAITRPDLIAFMTDRLIDTTDREGNPITILRPLPTIKRKKYA